MSTTNKTPSPSLGTRVTKTRNIVILGAPAVGKSAITIRFVEERFPELYNATIENTFQKAFRFKGQNFNTTITDTAGQDEHSIFPTRLCANVHGFVLVYSIASKASLELCHLINEKLLNTLGLDTAPRVLVGNMTDLDYERQVSSAEGKQAADEMGCSFVECSAKHNQNITKIFEDILRQIELDLSPAPAPRPCIIS
eukprot:c2579_g1_i1.p1 GENE.c2579_g1_i1~~c2579_g1_i1.p1  ORF type:complete len:204 (+),score=39.80 c2579_g1_i1:24-614(+)